MGGYKISGGDTMKCGENGFDRTPSCVAITCDKPAIDQAVLNPNTASISYNAVYTVTCNKGYKISGGYTMKCGENGFNHKPSCAAIKCSKPTIYRAVLKPSNDFINYDDVYTVTCSTGYMLSGGDTMKCGENGFDQTPSCIGPVLSNGNCAWIEVEHSS